MAEVKFTVQRGKPDLKDVTIGAGAGEAQSDTMSLNIDHTNLTKGEALLMVDNIKAKIAASPWPPQ